MSPALPRASRMPADARRNEIVAALVDLAGEIGPERITTQRVADHVGVTHGALFRHFADKDAMWAGVFDWIEARLGELLRDAMAGDDPPLGVLSRLFIAHAGFIADFPGVPRIVFGELQNQASSAFHGRAREMMMNYRKRVRALLAAAQADGSAAATLDTEAAATLFIGALQGLAVQRVLFRGRAALLASARKILALLLLGYRGVVQ